MGKSETGCLGRKISLNISNIGVKNPDLKISALLNQEKFQRVFRRVTRNIKVIDIVVRTYSIAELKKLSGCEIKVKSDVYKAAKALSLKEMPHGLMYHICTSELDFIKSQLSKGRNYHIFGSTFKLRSLVPAKESTLLIYRDEHDQMGLYADFGLYKYCDDDIMWLFIEEINVTHNNDTVERESENKQSIAA